MVDFNEACLSESAEDKNNVSAEREYFATPVRGRTRGFESFWDDLDRRLAARFNEILSNFSDKLTRV